MKTRQLLLLMFGYILSTTLNAQQIQDTLQVNFGESSNLIINLQSLDDYEVLRSYNLDSLVDQMTRNLEYQIEDHKIVEADEKDSKSKSYIIWNDEIIWKSKSTKADSLIIKKRKYPYLKKFFQIDVGSNNLISENGLSADSGNLYAVRHWGSWYVALNSVLDSRISRGFGVETSVGISWYNFKFQNDDTRISTDNGKAEFVLDERDRNNTKSKLTLAHINAQVVPIIKFGSRKRYGIGLGGYIGYRVDSYTKNVYEIDGNSVKDKNRDNLFLNRWRYGARLQFGVQGHTFFANYDLNQLFQEDNGPKLNGISLGIIL